MNEARPAQQISNPVKPPTWKSITNQFRPDVIRALDSLLEANPEYEKREVIDVALRDYLKLPEPVD